MLTLINQLKAYFDKDDLTYREVEDDMLLLGFCDDDGKPIQVQITAFEGSDYHCVKFASRYVFNLSDLPEHAQPEQVMRFLLAFNAYARFGAAMLVEGDEVCYDYTLMLGPNGISEDDYYRHIEALLHYTYVLRNDLAMLIDPEQPELPPYMA